MYKLIALLTTLFGYALCCKEGTLLFNTVTAQEKINIVKAHNLFRSCIALGSSSSACQEAGATDQTQPQAANMQEMSWDDAIAKEAQLWANNCEFKHNKVADSRFQVGQNLATTMSTQESSESEFKRAVQMWFDEHRNYRYAPITMEDFQRTGNDQIGHYTQVAWASTNKVGCGYSYYKANDGYYKKLYVCNYGPSGNFIGQTPYKKGQPSCQAHNLRDAATPGLCNSGLTDQNKREILDEHNFLRSCIATGSRDIKCKYLNATRHPEAKNMRKMKWSDKLAKLAQSWADQCRFELNNDYSQHEPCISQSLHLYATSYDNEIYGNPDSLKAIIHSWFDQQRYYNYTKHTTNNSTRRINKYTQIVWAKTSKLGCGFTSYKEGEYRKDLTVCYYEPCANINGEYPYEAGKSSCVSFSDIEGLCDNSCHIVYVNVV